MMKVTPLWKLLRLFSNPNVLVPTSKNIQVVKLCCNKII